MSDDEWACVAPYLTVMTEAAPQRVYPLREVCNALRWIVHTGVPWRYLPGDFPPWPVVSQQTRRWLAAGVFTALVHDLREMLRWTAGRKPQPPAVLIDSATRQSPPESGHRVGYDGSKKRKGRTLPVAVDTLGEVLALLVTPANAPDRAQVEALAAAVQDVTGNTVEVAFADQNYTGPDPAAAAAAQGIELVVIKLEEAKRGFVLLPRRWVVERSFAWAARFRRLAKDYERLPEVFAGLHFLAFVTLMLRRLLVAAGQSP